MARIAGVNQYVPDIHYVPFMRRRAAQRVYQMAAWFTKHAAMFCSHNRGISANALYVGRNYLSQGKEWKYILVSDFAIYIPKHNKNNFFQKETFTKHSEKWRNATPMNGGMYDIYDGKV